jgi:2,5-diamino-6-(ribosylamino)-4(3H)-pyrimidinone 5'-phosphate reductase
VHQHHPLLLRVFPEPVASIPVEEAYADLDLPPGKPGRPYTLINAISTLDGRGAVGGKSTPLGTHVDHRLMRNVRANVDAVLVGAGTLRSEDLTLSVDEPLARRREERGLKAQPLPIILSRSGNVPANRRIFRENNEGDVLILTGSYADGQQLARLSELATIRRYATAGLAELSEIVETLADEFAVRHLLVEGGPKVNRSFLEAQLVDELFLTLAPKIVGGESRSLIEGETLPHGGNRLDLISVHLSDSEIYLRFRRPF